MATMRDDSRGSWTCLSTTESIKAGSLQRIADATEKMAASYDNLRTDRDYYKREHAERGATIAILERRLAALRGVITKLKRKK